MPTATDHALQTFDNSFFRFFHSFTIVWHPNVCESSSSRTKYATLQHVCVCVWHLTFYNMMYVPYAGTVRCMSGIETTQPPPQQVGRGLKIESPLN